MTPRERLLFNSRNFIERGLGIITTVMSRRQTDTAARATKIPRRIPAGLRVGYGGVVVTPPDFADLSAAEMQQLAAIAVATQFRKKNDRRWRNLYMKHYPQDFRADGVYDDDRFEEFYLRVTYAIVQMAFDDPQVLEFIRLTRPTAANLAQHIIGEFDDHDAVVAAHVLPAFPPAVYVAADNVARVSMDPSGST